MSRLTPREQKLYSDFFKQVAETEGTERGTLTLESCEKVVQLCGYKLNTEAVKNFIKTEDDCEWEISLDDFLVSVSQVEQASSRDKRTAELRRLFQRHDLNRDGHVSFHELRSVMPRSVDESEIRGFIQDWDTDGDWKLSFEEFACMYNAQSPEGTEQDREQDSEQDSEQGSELKQNPELKRE